MKNNQKAKMDASPLKKNIDKSSAAFNSQSKRTMESITQPSGQNSIAEYPENRSIDKVLDEQSDLLLTQDKYRRRGNDLEPSYDPTEFIAKLRAHHHQHSTDSVD